MSFLNTKAHLFFSEDIPTCHFSWKSPGVADNVTIALLYSGVPAPSDQYQNHEHEAKWNTTIINCHINCDKAKVSLVERKTAIAAMFWFGVYVGQ